MASITEVNGSNPNIYRSSSSSKKEEFMETSLDGGGDSTASVTTGPSNTMAISIQTSEFSELKIMRTKMSNSRTTAIGSIGSSTSYPFVNSPGSPDGRNGSSNGDGDESSSPGISVQAGSGRSSSNPNSPLLSPSGRGDPQTRVTTSFSRSSVDSPNNSGDGGVDDVDSGAIKRILLHDSEPSLTKPKKHHVTSVHTSQPLPRLSQKYKFAQPPPPPTSLNFSTSSPPSSGFKSPVTHTVPIELASTSSDGAEDKSAMAKVGSDVKLREAFAIDSDVDRRSSKTGEKSNKNNRDFCTDLIVFLDECFMCHGE